MQPRKILKDFPESQNSDNEESVEDAPSIFDKFERTAVVIPNKFLIWSKVAFECSSFVTVMPGKSSAKLPYWAGKAPRSKCDWYGVAEAITLYRYGVRALLS